MASSIRPIAANVTPSWKCTPVVARAHRQRAAQLGERTVVLPRGAVGRADGDLCVDGQWIALRSRSASGNGRIEPPLPHEREAHRARQLLATVPHFGGPLQALAPSSQRQ